MRAFVVPSAALLTPDEPRLVATAAFEGHKLQGEVVPVQGLLGTAADRARQHAVSAAALAGVAVRERDPVWLQEAAKVARLVEVLYEVSASQVLSLDEDVWQADHLRAESV